MYRFIGNKSNFNWWQRTIKCERRLNRVTANCLQNGLGMRLHLKSSLVPMHESLGTRLTSKHACIDRSNPVQWVALYTTPRPPLFQRDMVHWLFIHVRVLWLWHSSASLHPVLVKVFCLVWQINVGATEHTKRGWGLLGRLLVGMYTDSLLKTWGSRENSPKVSKLETYQRKLVEFGMSDWLRGCLIRGIRPLH